MELAPRLCAVCQRPFDHKEERLEFGETAFFHVDDGEKCIRRSERPQERIPLWACAQYGGMHLPHMCRTCNRAYDRFKEEFQR